MIEFSFNCCILLIHIFIFTSIYKVLCISFESFSLACPLKENKNKKKRNIDNDLAIWLSHNTTSLKVPYPKDFTTCSRGHKCSPSSFVHSLIPNFSCSIPFSSSFIVSIVLCSLALLSFYLLQFLSNLTQYSLSYFLSDYPNNFLAVNLPGNSPLLKVPSFLSYLLMFSMSLLYSLSNSSITSFAFPKFSFPSQVSDSTVNPFHCTRYLSFSLTCHLFNILLTSHSSSPSIITGASCSFLCPSTCSTYFCILLTFTTRCIFTVLGSSNSTIFNDMIFFIL